MKYYETYDELEECDVPYKWPPRTMKGEIEPHDFPLIDCDPHFTRVLKLTRKSDWFFIPAYIGIMSTIGFAIEKWVPYTSIKRQTMVSVTFGLAGGFIKVYQRSCLRHYGRTENSREIEINRKDFIEARRNGLNHHLGISELPIDACYSAARITRYQAMFLGIQPRFNFVKHNLCVNWDLYKDLVYDSDSLFNNNNNNNKLFN